MVSVSLPAPLVNRAEQLAEQLNLSPSRVFELALACFIHSNPALPSVETPRQSIQQGDVYWLSSTINGLESDIAHPYVVIQDDLFNNSRLTTVVVCGLTSNLQRVNLPGNILLEAGEATLPKQSVIEVGKVATVDKTQLGDYIGKLSQQRVEQILAGMRFLQASFF